MKDRHTVHSAKIDQMINLTEKCSKSANKVPHPVGRSCGAITAITAIKTILLYKESVHRVSYSSELLTSPTNNIMTNACGKIFFFAL